MARTAPAYPNKRVVSLADGTSITPTSDNCDTNTHVNTQTAGTLTVNAPSGTPPDKKVIILDLKCTNAQTFSWDPVYRWSTTVTAPTASTGSSKHDYIVIMYNAADSKWDGVSVDYGH